jgi:hypothetical protein
MHRRIFASTTNNRSIDQSVAIRIHPVGIVTAKQPADVSITSRPTDLKLTRIPSSTRTLRRSRDLYCMPGRDRLRR